MSSVFADIRSITLSWRRPTTPCVIKRYYVSYDGAAKWGNRDRDQDIRKIEVENDEDLMTYLIDDLQPYSTYTLAVLAETSAGNGTQWATVADQSTLEDGNYFTDN